MINEDKRKCELTAEIQRIADNGRREYTELIEREFTKRLPQISGELWEVMREIHTRYRDLERSGRVGPLRWIHLSFLRTGLLDHSPCYRIDFYDSLGCISEVECAGAWGFDDIFDGYYDIKRQILERWGRQSQFQTYEADDILCQLAMYFRRLADDRLLQVLSYLLEEREEILSFGKGIRVMLGEFLDHSELVAEIGADTGADIRSDTGCGEGQDEQLE